jgi:hypothetical protein
MPQSKHNLLLKIVTTTNCDSCRVHIEKCKAWALMPKRRGWKEEDRMEKNNGEAMGMAV